MNRPFQNTCTNHGHGRDFTCPSCYADLPYEEWQGKTAPCPDCNRAISCTVEDEPVSICRLATPDDSHV